MNSNTQTVSEHELVFGELAWYANGTLPENQAARVESHLPECRICREELNLLQKTIASVQTPTAGSAQVDKALARTMQRIDAFEQNRQLTDNTVQSPTAGNGNPTNSSWLVWVRQWIIGTDVRWTTGAVAVCAAMLVGLQWLLPSVDGEYSVLTSDDQTAAALSLRVRFRQSSGPAEVIRMVQQVGVNATVLAVDDRVYLVRLPDDAALDKLNKVFEQFDSNPSVESVEAVLKPR